MYLMQVGPVGSLIYDLGYSSNRPFRIPCWPRLTILISSCYVVIIQTLVATITLHVRCPLICARFRVGRKDWTSGALSDHREIPKKKKRRSPADPAIIDRDYREALRNECIKDNFLSISFLSFHWLTYRGSGYLRLLLGYIQMS